MREKMAQDTLLMISAAALAAFLLMRTNREPLSVHRTLPCQQRDVTITAVRGEVSSKEDLDCITKANPSDFYVLQNDTHGVVSGSRWFVPDREGPVVGAAEGFVIEESVEAPGDVAALHGRFPSCLAQFTVAAKRGPDGDLESFVKYMRKRGGRFVLFVDQCGPGAWAEMVRILAAHGGTETSSVIKLTDHEGGQTLVVSDIGVETVSALSPFCESDRVAIGVVARLRDEKR